MATDRPESDPQTAIDDLLKLDIPRIDLSAVERFNAEMKRAAEPAGRAIEAMRASMPLIEFPQASKAVLEFQRRLETLRQPPWLNGFLKAMETERELARGGLLGVSARDIAEKLRAATGGLVDTSPLDGWRDSPSINLPMPSKRRPMTEEDARRVVREELDACFSASEGLPEDRERIGFHP